MRTLVRRIAVLLCLCPPFIAPRWLPAQTAGNAGTLIGTVTDPSGAVVPEATVTIDNLVSAYARTAMTDKAGRYQFTNLPLNPYHLKLSATGFAATAEDVEVRSTVPVVLNLALQLGGASSTVTVEGSQDLLENDPTFHTDVDRQLFQKIAARKPVVFR